MGGARCTRVISGRGALLVKLDEEGIERQALPVVFPTNWEARPADGAARGPNSRRPLIATDPSPTRTSRSTYTA